MENIFATFLQTAGLYDSKEICEDNIADLIELLKKKYARVIECLAKQQGLSLDEAMGLFYHSEVYQLMRDGVSDMHCMSDLYLVEELRLEYTEKFLENCQ